MPLPQTLSYLDAEEPLSLTDQPTVPVPPQQVVQARSARTNYALGEKSPGTEEINQRITAGEEGNLRDQVSADEESNLHLERQGLLRGIAEKGNLNQEDMSLMQYIVNTDTKVDPSTILEKKLGQKIVSDVAQSRPQDVPLDHPDSQQVLDSVAELKTWHEYFQNKYYNLMAEWKDTGWLSATYDYAEHLVTGIPATYRLNKALADKPGISFLLGNTLNDNISYLWSLSPADRKYQFDAAINYLKPRSMLDAMTFAQAMVSYGTSDHVMNNFVSFGDAAMIGAPSIKLLSRLTRGRKAVEAAADIGKAAEAPKVPVVSPYKQPEEQPWTGQLNLFHEPDEQGSFRFMYDPDQRATTPGGIDQNVNAVGAVRNPKTGRMTRATTRTATFQGEDGPFGIPHNRPETEVSPTGQFREPNGRFNRSTEAMRQQDLPLDQPPSQGDLFGGGGPVGGAGPRGGSAEAKYAAAPKAKPTVDLSPATPADPTKDLRVALTEAHKASADIHATPDQILSATGNVPAAGTVGMMRRLADPLTELKDISQGLPSFASPGSWMRDAKYLSREYAQRLTNQVKKQADDLLQKAASANKTARIPEAALIVARQQAEIALKNEYATRPHFSDHVVDIQHIPGEASIFNRDVAVMRLGKSTAEGFDSPAQAETMRRDVFRLGPNEGYVTRQGDAYFIELPKTLDETHPLVRDALWSPENRSPVSFFRSLTRWLRTSDDLLAPFQRANRKVAQHAMQGVRSHISELEDKVINALPRKELDELNQMLVINQKTINPDNPSTPGAWFKSAGEWEQAFIERFGKPPTPAQTVAYDTYVRVNDFDYLLRNLAIVRDYARQGVESFSVKVGNESTPTFNGKLHEKFPWEIGKKGDHDATIWVYDATKNEGRFHYKFDMNDVQRKELDDKIASGQYRVIQVANPNKHPLEGFAKTADGSKLKEPINYVVTNSWEKEALSWKQLDYTPGPHVIYPHKWFVSMPIIREGRSGKMTYFGDNVALNVSSEAEAKLWAGRLDELRVLYKSGDKPGTLAFLRDKMPAGFDAMMMQKLFTHSDAPFSLENPVTYKEAGKSTLETNPVLRSQFSQGNLVDATRNPHDLSALLDKGFMQDRDLLLNTLDKTGMRLTPAELLDPLQSLHKGLNQSLRNLWMNDVKTSAIEQFYRQFGSLMEPPAKTLQAFPSHFLFHPQWVNSASNRWEELAAAKATQRAIVNFLGVQSELGGAMKAYETKVQSFVFKHFGNSLANRMDMETHPILNAIKDPVNFMRQMAFHMNLGLLNPTQLFVQAAQMNHAIAVTGVENGIAAMTGAMGLNFLSHNPGQLDAIAKLMTKMHLPKTGLFGWEEKHFRELAQLSIDSGIQKVAGEASLRNQLDPPLRSWLGRMVFDVGPMFFNEGERMTRFTGLAAAYREARTLNPAKALTQRDIAKIMDRADDITGNMTRASSASWQEGIASVPTQFFPWTARMVEQMTTGLVHDLSGGKYGIAGRLTGTEKARALITYSVMYGAPIGLGSVVGGWPIYDGIKEEAVKRGIDLSPKYMEFLTEGLYEMVLHAATGKHTNIAPRVGPGNNQQLREILNGDESFAATMLGASGGALGGIIKSMAPFYYWTASVATNTGEFPLTSTDWMGVFRNIRTLDNAAKAYGAAMYHEWQTKTGTVVGKADGMDAVLAILGLTPLDVANTFTSRKALKSEKDIYTAYEQEAFTSYRRGTQALINGDKDAASSYFTQAKTLLEMGKVPWDRRERFYHRAISQYKDLSDQVKWDLLQNSPTDRRDERLKQYQR